MKSKIWLLVVAASAGLWLASLVGCEQATSQLTASAQLANTMATANAGLAQESAAVNPPGVMHVELKQIAEGWQIMRDGKPYFIKGAGGAGNEGPMPLLVASGANSTRTWGVTENTKALLDDAHKNGLSVTVGIWLEHERLGMDYTDYQQVVDQIDLTMKHVKALKNHPAILIWGIGNEMEGQPGNNPAIWSHIEHLARLIKAEDPHHPVMTVIAEMGGNKIEAMHKLCPSLDIIGINSYGGGPSVPKRYRENGGKKPYIITEFGPFGTWEVGKNSIDAIIEPTSTEKVSHYRNSLTAFQNDKELCLGAYAFLWGNKQEGTETWFGMLTPDGKKTATVDLMSEFWTGKPPENLCPRIQSLKLEGPNLVEKGANVKVNLVADDPEAQPLNVKWVLRAEASTYVTSGDFQETPQSFEDAIVKSDNHSALVKLPSESGLYRIYAFVDDGQNAAATANIPVRVKAPPVVSKRPQAELPLVIYDEPGTEVKYYPSGYMGSTDAIELDEKSQDEPKFGQHCLKCEFSKIDDWGGVVWQDPENDWGDAAGGFNLSGAKKLTFWARGKSGGEKIKFGFGILGSEKKYSDSAKKELELTITPEWKQYSIELDSLDLHCIKTGFVWSLAGQGKPVTFYLDRIAFE